MAGLTTAAASFSVFVSNDGSNGTVGGTIARADTTVPSATTRPAVDGTTATTDPKPAAPFVYQVALTDDAGNITAVQKFDNLKDASNFAADVGRWQAAIR